MARPLALILRACLPTLSAPLAAHHSRGGWGAYQHLPVASHPPTHPPTHPHTGAWVGQWKLRKANMTPSPQELARIETEYQKWLGKGAYLHVEMSYPAIEKRITIEEATSKLGKQCWEAK